MVSQHGGWHSFFWKEPVERSSKVRKLYLGFGCFHHFCQGKFLFFLLFTNIRNFESIISVIIINEMWSLCSFLFGMHANEARIISLMEVIILANCIHTVKFSSLIIYYTCKSWLPDTIISIWVLPTRPDKFKRDVMSFTVCETMSVLHPADCLLCAAQEMIYGMRRVFLINDQWFDPSESNSCHKIRVKFNARAVHFAFKSYHLPRW